MKNKKYVFELVVRESESLEKICSTITACDYSFEELKERKVDHEILFCKDILFDQLPKEKLKQILKNHVSSIQQDPPYPNFASSWDDNSYKEVSKQKYPPYMDLVGCCDVEPKDKAYNKALDECGKLYGFYHKSTKLWVYFLPNYERRQVISLGLKNNATFFTRDKINYFTKFLKSCSFNGNKNYALENFLEFELKEI
jgi:hypothetical protein